MSHDPMEFIVAGQPRTMQTKSPKSRQDWRDRCRRSAQNAAAMTGDSLEYSVSITHFHSDANSVDIDNIIKPILDALKGIVWEDDLSVVEVRARRTDLSREFNPINPSSILVEALIGYPEFIWVRIAGPPQHEELEP